MNHLPRSLSGLLALGLVMTASTAFAKGNLEGALKFVAPEFTTVVAVDVDHVRASPLFAVATATIKDEHALKDIRTATGLDPLKDIKSIVVAGPDQFIKDSKLFVAIIEGTFDEKKIVAFMKSQGELTEKDGPGGKIYAVQDRALAFRGGFLVAGTPALLDRALAAGKGIAGGKLARMYGVMKGFKGGFVLLGGSAQLKKWLSKNAGKDAGDFKDAEALGVGVDLAGGGIDVEIRTSFGSEASAATLASRLDAAAKEGVADRDMQELGLSKAIGKISAVAKGKDTVVGVKLSKDEAKPLIDLLKEMVSGR